MWLSLRHCVYHISSPVKIVNCQCIYIFVDTGDQGNVIHVWQPVVALNVLTRWPPYARRRSYQLETYYCFCGRRLSNYLITFTPCGRGLPYSYTFLNVNLYCGVQWIVYIITSWRREDNNSSNDIIFNMIGRFYQTKKIFFTNMF